MSDDHGAASYRAAGVDYDALDAGKRMAMAKALSTSSLLAARRRRALDASRGEPAFVFELDGRAFAFVVEGLGTKSIIARHVLEEPGDQPLRRRRLRHGRGDPQRPLLCRRAAAGGQRLLRDRRLRLVPRARAWLRVARGLARRRAPTPAARGEEGSRRRCPGSSTSGTSSWRAPPSAWCRRGARRSSARSCGPAMRSCSCPRAACTPTAPRWPGCSPGACPTGTPPRCPTARRSGRRCWRRR